MRAFLSSSAQRIAYNHSWFSAVLHLVIWGAHEIAAPRECCPFFHVRHSTEKEGWEPLFYVIFDVYENFSRI